MATFKAPLTRLLKKAFTAEDTPDPWDDETDKAVRDRETTAVCTRCLEPGANETWLCRNCGFPSGGYVNNMPYLYIFSIGAFFRSDLLGFSFLCLNQAAKRSQRLKGKHNICHAAITEITTALQCGSHRSQRSREHNFRRE